MRPASSPLSLVFASLLGLAFAAPARAGIVLSAKAVTLPGARLQDVNLHLDDDGEGGLRLQLQAAKADVPAMGWRRLGLHLDGTLQRDALGRWLLDGPLQLKGAPGGALSNATVGLVVDEAANTIQVDLAQAKAAAHAAIPLDQPSHAQIELDRLPAGWLQGLLGAVWTGRVNAGQLDAQLALDVHEDGVQSSGAFSVDQLGFDSPSGTLAGQRIGGSGRLDLDTTGGAARVDMDASLRGGELLLGRFYARLPEHPVQLGVGIDAKDGALAFDRLHVGDADALQLDGTLAFTAKGELERLQLERLEARFPAAYDRYGQAWLDAALGLRGMHAGGMLSGTLDLRADGLHAFAFDTAGLDLADGDGRFEIDGLHGGLDWAVAGERPATTLGWRQLRFYRIVNGAAQSRWQSRAGALGLLAPLEVPVLGGQWHVGEFAWRPAAAQGQRLAASLALTGVDMGAFGRAVGWPAFPGTLGGAVPSLRWVDDRVELAGGLSVNVFGGFVDVTRLSLEQPFGASPVLSGDVSLRQLDLGAMTGVFDFGNITGRLDGTVQGLRLVGWSPIAFDAQLLAGGGGRISQRAVNNLTAMGGGGLASGLQGAMLRLFKTFGYSRIGLSCKLQDAVCQMGGLDGGADGYTIVDGNGLPHLQVVGHQTRVDWPTLVRRLKAAVSGAAPEVR